MAIAAVFDRKKRHASTNDDGTATTRRVKSGAKPQGGRRRRARRCPRGLAGPLPFVRALAIESASLRRTPGITCGGDGCGGARRRRRGLADRHSRRSRARRGAGEVAIFYYPWYGHRPATVAGSTGSRTATRRRPQIASGWFPARGPYSSSDPAVVRAQMREIASIGVQTVIVSWWGAGSAEAARLPAVARAARAAGLRVALHVEPFAGRTRAALEPALRVVRERGDHRFLRLRLDHDARQRLAGAQRASPAGCGCSPTRACRARPSRVASRASTPMTSTSTTAARSHASALRHGSCGLLCAPSVGPGYDAMRATGDVARADRSGGATYDRMWRGAIRAAADVVTITSYNEWHEGTQIEPARGCRAAYALVRRRLRPHRARRPARVPRSHGDLGAPLPRTGLGTLAGWQRRGASGPHAGASAARPAVGVTAIE